MGPELWERKCVPIHKGFPMFLDTPKDLGHQRGKLPSGAGDSQTCTKEKTCGECRSYMVQSPVE